MLNVALSIHGCYQVEKRQEHWDLLLGLTGSSHFHIVQGTIPTLCRKVEVK